MMNRERTMSSGKNILLTVLSTILFTVILTGCSGKSGQKNILPHISDARLTVLSGGVCQDTKTGLIWQTEKSTTIKSLAEAQGYTESLGAGGYDDWRLPTVTELYDLYMTFDLHQNGDCQMQIEGTYWSDEPDLDGRVGTWELNDNCDPERQYIPKQKGQVLAVRS
jgi:Protein of unknown function (DUF1566)